MAAEIPRFVFSGGFATALHWTSMALLIALDFPPLSATALGATIGLSANYYLQRRFTFRSNRRHSTALPAYLMSAGFGWLINLLTFSVAHATFNSVASSQLAASVVAATTNYMVMKKYVFQSA
jgi:putative flippase GtrA